jgi:hypothetical protein
VNEENPTMAAKKSGEPLKLGDLVKIRHSGFKRARVVELRGPLAPGGKQVYRVIVRRKPTPMYIELTEDDVELIPADPEP